MAVLSNEERAEITAQAQRSHECPGPLSKAQLRAVVDSMDTLWETTGAAAVNAAIPLPQRNLLSVREKYFLFQSMLDRKYKGL
jgi:hypothetical protein